MSTSENKEVVQNWVASRNANNLQGALEYWTPDNHDWLKNAFHRFSTAFPDIHVTINEIIAEADKVMVIWTLTGTHRGIWRGIPGTGNPVEWHATDLYTISNGKIADLVRNADHLDLLRQLGAVTTWQDRVID
jgi:steroid delta-isomerase-like uncharacterized protein